MITLVEGEFHIQRFVVQRHILKIFPGDFHRRYFAHPEIGGNVVVGFFARNGCIYFVQIGIVQIPEFHVFNRNGKRCRSRACGNFSAESDVVFFSF